MPRGWQERAGHNPEESALGRGMAVPGEVQRKEQRGQEGWSCCCQGDLTAEPSFKINQFGEDTTGSKQRAPHLPHEQHRVWEDLSSLKTCWRTNLTSSLCAGTEMGAGVPQQNPAALALHLQQPLSRLEMFPEDGARWAQSWQGPRGGIGCAELRSYEAKEWSS